MRLKRTAIFVMAGLWTLAGCGDGQEAKNRASVSSTQLDGVPFVLDVELGDVVKPSKSTTLVDMAGGTTVPLGDAKCPIDWAADEAREITVQAENKGQGNMRLDIDLEVLGPQDEPMTPRGARRVSVVWLSRGMSDCSVDDGSSTLRDPGLHGESTSPLDPMASGFLILHGGSKKFEGYVLRVSVEGGDATTATTSRPAPKALQIPLA